MLRGQRLGGDHPHRGHDGGPRPRWRGAESLRHPRRARRRATTGGGFDGRRWEASPACARAPRPSLIHAVTFRHTAHTLGGPRAYRPPTRSPAASPRGPIARCRAALELRGALPAAELDAGRRRTRRDGQDGNRFASAEPYPDRRRCAFRRTSRTWLPPRPWPFEDPAMPTMTYLEAGKGAPSAEAMEADPTSVPRGGPRAGRGVVRAVPGARGAASARPRGCRMRPSQRPPIMGVAAGAAMTGTRTGGWRCASPDFALLRHRRAREPGRQGRFIVRRAVKGGRHLARAHRHVGRSSAAQHSQVARSLVTRQPSWASSSPSAVDTGRTTTASSRLPSPADDPCRLHGAQETCGRSRGRLPDTPEADPIRQGRGSRARAATVHRLTWSATVHEATKGPTAPLRRGGIGVSDRPSHHCGPGTARPSSPRHARTRPPSPRPTRRMQVAGFGRRWMASVRRTRARSVAVARLASAARGPIGLRPHHGGVLR